MFLLYCRPRSRTKNHVFCVVFHAITQVAHSLGIGIVNGVNKNVFTGTSSFRISSTRREKREMWGHQRPPPRSKRPIHDHVKVVVDEVV